MLRRLWTRTLAFFVFSGFLLMGAAPLTAQASSGIYGTASWNGGYYPNGYMPMFGPFYETPFIPAQYPVYYQTGQMNYTPPSPVMDWTPVFVSNAFNWNGTQPMGTSYLPAVGMTAIGNSYLFGQVFGEPAY